MIHQGHDPCSIEAYDQILSYGKKGYAVDLASHHFRSGLGICVDIFFNEMDVLLL